MKTKRMLMLFMSLFVIAPAVFAETTPIDGSGKASECVLAVKQVQNVDDVQEQVKKPSKGVSELIQNILGSND